MAQLLRSLAVSGSRKSDGTANASGKVFLYTPGTSTIVPGYKDDFLSEAWTTVSGGIPLDAGGRVKIWINDPVTVVVSDSDGSIVDTFDGFNKTRAEQVEVENENYTGALTDDATGEVTQGLGGRIPLDVILGRAGTSLGPDFKYKESAGATTRPYIEVISGMQISVKDFGAVGNGIADDTVAIQAAASEAKRLGSRIVFFDAGTYKTSAVAITLQGITGIEFRGAGKGASILTQSTPATNAITITTSTDFSIRSMSVTGSVVLTDAVRPVFEHVIVDGVWGISLGGTLSSDARIYNCYLTGSTNALLLTNTVRVTTIGSQYNNLAGTGVMFAGSTGGILMTNCAFAALTGVLFDAALTGTEFVITGSPSLGSNCTTPIDMTGLANDPQFRQWGNRVDGYTVNVASGGTTTPNRAKGRHVRIRGTSTGVAYVTNLPTPPPVATTPYDVTMILDLFNNAGAPITGWGLDAGYHVAAPSLVDGEHTTYLIVWDPSASVWRQISRSVTT